MKPIIQICKDHSLKLFEDCAHSIGSTVNGRHVGSYGDGSLLSFGIYKIINAFGGGALVLRNSKSEAREDILV